MRILRYTVPVDGETHAFHLSGPIMHAAARSEATVDFWALDSGGPKVERRLTVVGTGAPLPEPYTYLKTAVTPSGQYVWHLLEVQ